MNTLEMMIEAKGTNKVFKINDLYYSESKGFTNNEFVLWKADEFISINEIFELSGWKEVVDIAELEKDILEAVDKEYKYIVRDKNGALCVYNHLPRRESYYWNCQSGNRLWCRSLEVFNHLFQFITWDSEPFKIEDLIK